MCSGTDFSAAAVAVLPQLVSGLKVHCILRGGTSFVSLSAALKAELDIFVLRFPFFGKFQYRFFNEAAQ